MPLGAPSQQIFRPSSAIGDDEFNIMTMMARRTFSKNIGKLIRAHEEFGGWEKWAQMEIALANRPGAEYRPDEILDYGLRSDLYVKDAGGKRERAVYADGKICDWLIELGRFDSDQRIYLVVEMKCMMKNQLADFIRAVDEDITKVKRTQLKEPWRSTISDCCVAAITVDEQLTGEPAVRMKELAGNRSIFWSCCRLSPRDDRVVMWTWTIKVSPTGNHDFWNVICR